MSAARRSQISVPDLKDYVVPKNFLPFFLYFIHVLGNAKQTDRKLVVLGKIRKQCSITNQLKQEYGPELKRKRGVAGWTCGGSKILVHQTGTADSRLKVNFWRHY